MKRGIFISICLFVWMIIFVTDVTADEKSTRLFILETEEATIYKELTIEGGIVVKSATASRTSYQYNNYPNENLANIEMSHRSQAYNSRAGYRHFYSVLPSYAEEMLDVDYVEAGEYHQESVMTSELFSNGFVETSGTLEENPMLTGRDLYLSGLIILEYQNDTLFNRVEIDYIGENIFKMRSMMEPSLEYYGYNSVNEFIEVSEQHKRQVNGEGYNYSYYVDNTFLGETTEVKFFLMDVDEFFMNFYGLNEVEYYERYPGGVDSVFHRVNDYLNRGYEVTYHEDRTPEGFEVNYTDVEQFYDDLAGEFIEMEEEPEEIVEDPESEENALQPDDETGEDSEEVLEEIEETASDSVPTESPAIPGLHAGEDYIVTYHRDGETLQFAHQDGLISHGYAVIRAYVNESELQMRLDDAYQTQQFFSEVSGIDTSYQLSDNVLDTKKYIDYGAFTLGEQHLQRTHEFLPIYMSYRLADVHLELLNQGYSFENISITADSGTVTLLDLKTSSTYHLDFEAGIVVSDGIYVGQPINEVFENTAEGNYIIINIK